MVLVFLAFLLLAVHVTARLYLTTSAQGLAFDAARSVARAEVDHHDPAAVGAAAARATDDLRDALGAGRVRQVRWDLTRADDVVGLRVEVALPGNLLGDTVTTAVRVRVEELR